jgi:ABC-type dipeptide/oligopeptide/nickel transport system ATPase component
MKIKTIEYYNKALDWRLNPVDFTNSFSNLTLLVGVSGVGKTQIIKSILNLKDIANGKSLSGVKWNIKFENLDGVEYQWQGEFENQGLTLEFFEEDEGQEKKFKIINESLSKNGIELVNRINNKINFRKVEIPKLSPFESVVNILSEEEDVAPVKEGFDKIIQLSSDIGIDRTAFLIKKSKNPTLEEIQKSNLRTQSKLALVSNGFPNVFKKIKDRFIDIFPQVEDIKLEPVKEITPILLKGFLDKYPFIHIKERGVDKWIVQDNLSSGMFKSLMHISEIYLAPEGSVIIIDEFENSLGINCIDVLTEDLLVQNRNLQFIITSHHPYIINNIGMEHWKIVTRRGGVVTVKDAQDFNLGKSRHQAFIQLLNLEAYSEGIAVE